MKKIIYILKVLLLYVTAFAIIFVLSSVDGFINTYPIHGIVSICVTALLCFTCYKVITKDFIETFCKKFGIDIKEY